jgi:NTP pyrophosphatase (non-canonical NTP hydrolase)
MDINQTAQRIHDCAHSKGFYGGNRCPGPPCVHMSGSAISAIMLVVTELAEAVEAIRKSDRVNFREEIADATIRLFDLAAAEGIDLAAEMETKMKFNETRPYRHGKTC